MNSAGNFPTDLRCRASVSNMTDLWVEVDETCMWDCDSQAGDGPFILILLASDMQILLKGDFISFIFITPAWSLRAERKQTEI